MEIANAQQYRVIEPSSARLKRDAIVTPLVAVFYIAGPFATEQEAIADAEVNS